jgi:pyridoxine 4-dehydrogenase
VLGSDKRVLLTKIQTGRIKSFEDIEKVNPNLLYYPRFQRDNFAQNLELLHEVERIATNKGCTPAQVAIAWVMSHNDKPGMPTIIALPGASTRERVIENCKDVKLSDDELKDIETILSQFKVSGDRYPPAFMAQLDP